MTLPSLPVFDLYIAFNPNEGSTALLAANTQALPSSGSSNSYWTNCSVYLRDFSTNSGKQHYLDRIEAATLTLTVNNRDGFFMNGAVNGSSYVIQSRCPIALTATWSGTTYPVFWGLIDEAIEVITDQQNSDLRITASDLLKQLSLKYMSSTNFWPTYAASASAVNWYRCDATQTASLTSASGNGTTVTYVGINNFASGDNVTISGFGITSGTSLNLNNVTIATASATGFTVTNATVGASSGTGSAYRTRIFDQLGSTNGSYIGNVSFPSYGAMIYDADGCADLANGTGIGGSNSSGYIRLGDYANIGAIDFWVNGTTLAGSGLAYNLQSGTTNIELFCNSAGQYTVDVGAGPTVYNSGVTINDGFWHHIGITSNSGGTLLGYVDGTTFAIGGALTTLKVVTPNLLLIGAAQTAFVPGLNGYADEIVLSSNANLSTLTNEVTSRYTAGSLLQLPVNPSQAGVLSGDRIAHVLCIAGFGSVVNGAVVLNTDIYYINNGSAWSSGTSTNGYLDVGPYYFDTPITTSTALDIIGQITDTDIGSFFQKPDGTFSFLNQNFYGLWTWTQSTSSVSVGTGSKTFTVGTGLTLSAGAGVVVTGVVSSMVGTVTSYNSGTGSLVISVATTYGSGTFASWNVGSWHPSYSAPSGDHVWTDDGSSNYPYEPTTCQPIRDDADTWTMVEVTPQAGTQQTYENVQAETRWGYSVLTKTSTVHPTLNAALSTAYYLGYLFASPLPRIGAVELLSSAFNGGEMTAIIGAKLGDPVTFKRNSPNASTSGTYPTSIGAINAPFVIESIQVDFEAETALLKSTFQLDPYPLRT